MVRAVVVTQDILALDRGEGSTANPNAVGLDTAAQTIQTTMREAIAMAGVTPEQIAAVGVGVAGAASHHYHTWLDSVVNNLRPDTIVIHSTDYEIALVGALAKAESVLILAGTGSVAYGINGA